MAEEYLSPKRGKRYIAQLRNKTVSLLAQKSDWYEPVEVVVYDLSENAKYMKLVEVQGYAPPPTPFWVAYEDVRLLDQLPDPPNTWSVRLLNFLRRFYGSA